MSRKLLVFVFMYSAIVLSMISDTNAAVQINVPETGFSRISMRGEGVLKLVQGDTPSISVEGDEDAAGKIAFHGIDKSLNQGFVQIKDTKIGSVYTIVVKDLDQIRLHGRVQCEGSGVVNNKGSLSLQLYNLSSLRLSVNAGRVVVEMSDESYVNLAGSTENSEIKLSGKSIFDGVELTTSNCMSVSNTLDDGGLARVGCAKKLRVKEYKCSPSLSPRIGYVGSPDKEGVFSFVLHPIANATDEEKQAFLQKEEQVRVVRAEGASRAEAARAVKAEEAASAEVARVAEAARIEEVRAEAAARAAEARAEAAARAAEARAEAARAEAARAEAAKAQAARAELARAQAARAGAAGIWSAEAEHLRAYGAYVLSKCKQVSRRIDGEMVNMLELPVLSDEDRELQQLRWEAHVACPRLFPNAKQPENS